MPTLARRKSTEKNVGDDLRVVPFQQIIKRNSTQAVPYKHK